jgi:hypothetical protein
MPLLTLTRFSECIDLLYSQNTFAFDDQAWFDPFLASLLPSRARLITSFHLEPVFAREWRYTRSRQFYIANQPSVTDTIRHLEYVFNSLRIRPGVHSLTITPKLGLDFTTTCDANLLDFVPRFTHWLTLLKNKSYKIIPSALVNQIFILSIPKYSYFQTLFRSVLPVLHT